MPVSVTSHRAKCRPVNVYTLPLWAEISKKITNSLTFEFDPFFLNQLAASYNIDKR